MSGEILSSAGAEIRDNLVTTAVKFLTNPNVQRCTLESKERFLRSKGLTDLEIQKAIEKCGELVDLPTLTSELMFFHHSRRSWFRDNVLPLIIYGGFAYGCYWFYKNCIRHLLFVEEPKRKSTAECIDEVRKSLDVLSASVSSLRGELSSHAALRGQLDALKADVASVKGILLSRSQFPALARAEPASLPAWQLAGGAGGQGAGEGEGGRSRSSESGGSSEGERAAKNSDSSLEIMSESMVKIRKRNQEQPKRPMSAYMLWLDSNRASIKAAYPGLRPTELGKKGAEIWKKMDQNQKAEWERKSAEGKAQYEKDVSTCEDRK